MNAIIHSMLTIWMIIKIHRMHYIMDFCLCSLDVCLLKVCLNYCSPACVVWLSSISSYLFPAICSFNTEVNIVGLWVDCVVSVAFKYENGREGALCKSFWNGTVDRFTSGFLLGLSTLAVVLFDCTKDATMCDAWHSEEIALSHTSLCSPIAGIKVKCSEQQMQFQCLNTSKMILTCKMEYRAQQYTKNDSYVNVKYFHIRS